MKQYDCIAIDHGKSTATASFVPQRRKVGALICNCGISLFALEERQSGRLNCVGSGGFTSSDYKINSTSCPASRWRTHEGYFTGHMNIIQPDDLGKPGRNQIVSFKPARARDDRGTVFGLD